MNRRFRLGSTGRQRRSERGANLVEYAFTLMIFLAMLFGVCAFGHALYAYHFVSHAARQATRYAAVHGSTCNADSSCFDVGPAGPNTRDVVENYVKSIVPAGLDVANVHITQDWPSTIPANCTTTKNAPGCIVLVKVSYDYGFIFPLVRNSPLSLSSTSQMVIAH